jgi:predicted ester cyclase
MNRPNAEETRNTEIVRRFIDEAVNRGNLAVVDDTWSIHAVWNGGSLGTFHGRDALKAFMAANAAAAWKNMHLEIHELIAKDDKVVLRFTNSGDNNGPFMGNPATGKHAEWLGIGIYIVRDGRITQGWLAEDILSMLTQLHAFPPPTHEHPDPR